MAPTAQVIFSCGHRKQIRYSGPPEDQANELAKVRKGLEGFFSFRFGLRRHLTSSTAAKPMILATEPCPRLLAVDKVVLIDSTTGNIAV
ncbi:hypothetical protein Dda_4498 [Drechslerella dactyloides]|uniref:Uncharacterized protein n=1 Tax=Drechslerella dactyloides TaxID=74499 RepID=A0AAD6NJ64_DREDA|nr:hypothetical protein Dda_4498 [Drechslerella dactyloides]